MVLMAEDKDKGNVSSDPSWEKSRIFFKREKTKRHGQTAKETYSPFSQTLRTSENFPDAYRSYIKPVEGSESTPEQKEIMEVMEDYAVFLNKQEQTYIKVANHKPETDLIVTAGQLGEIFKSLGHLEKPLLTLKYDRKLTQARFLPEVEPLEVVERNTSGPWQDKIKTVVSFLKDEEEDRRDMEAWFVEDAIEKLGGKENPNVQRALDLGQIAYREILEQILLDDKEYYGGLFEKRGLPEKLTQGALRELKFHGLDALTPQELINSTLADLIQDLTIDNMRGFGNYFEINSFGDGSFSWKEIEFEDLALKDIKLEDEVSKEKALNEGEAPYGETIAIQDNKYRVQRDGQLIKITCVDNKQRQRWQAAFPLEIDSENIHLAIKNP
ncbi:MAG: hypothetical protein Q7R44_00955, partial [bacterium]|nr:hypothetical protein [bacterium]